MTIDVSYVHFRTLSTQYKKPGRSLAPSSHQPTTTPLITHRYSITHNTTLTKPSWDSLDLTTPPWLPPETRQRVSDARSHHLHVTSMRLACAVHVLRSAPVHLHSLLREGLASLFTPSKSITNPVPTDQPPAWTLADTTLIADHKAYWSENGNGYQPTGKFFPGFEKGWNETCDKLEKGEDLGDIEAEAKAQGGGDPDAWELEHGYKRGAQEAQKAGGN